MLFMMNQKLFQALSNETRLEILHWLKNPLEDFNESAILLSKDSNYEGGVCVRDIQEKSGLSQSTISSYLSMLKDVGLLESKRHGKWTYYRRNEKFIEELAEKVKEQL